MQTYPEIYISMIKMALEIMARFKNKTSKDEIEAYIKAAN